MCSAIISRPDSIRTGPNLHLLCYPLAGILLVSVFQRYVLRKDYSRSTYMLSLAIASGRYRMTKSSILNSVLTCGLTIGFGCTAGSEGPVAYSGAAIGSNVGRWLGLSDQWLRILIGIGAGAGIAGIFKSPTGGVLFTLEVLQLPMQTMPGDRTVHRMYPVGNHGQGVQRFLFRH